MYAKIALLLSLLTISQSAIASDPYWYGTITFTKELNTVDTTVYQAGEPYFPGIKLDTVAKSWSGELRFLPGKKEIISARYIESYTSDRKTNKMGPCPWRDEPAEYHDYELLEKKTNFSTNREVNGGLWIRIKPDGSYKSSASATGGNHVEDATQVHTRREFYEGCRSDPLSVNDQRASSSDGMESVDFENISGITDPNAQTLTGSWKGKDTDGGELSYSWDLTLIAPKLIAKIDSPTVIERAQVITLDASPSSGNIKDYTWEFVPNGDCSMTPQGSQIKLKGKKVSFMALCDFTAYLDVEDEDDIESAKVLVLVTPRKGDAWKTSYKTKVGANLTSRIISNSMHLGVNQCTLHSGDFTAGHYIHTDAENNRTWRDDGYKMIQVSDSGPFQGSWYVESQKLAVDRTERVNANLLPGGEIYNLNVANNNLADIQKLAAQVKKHESIHSTLLQEELLRLGTDGDAAVKIEKLVLPEEVLFQDMADREVREVNTLLFDASSEENVKNRLKSIGGFTKSVSIWLPISDGDNDPTNDASTQKDMGPLWSIGDH